MTRAARQELHRRRCSNPLGEQDLRDAIDATWSALYRRFQPSEWLQAPVARLQVTALDAVIASARFPGASFEDVMGRLKMLLPPGLTIEGVVTPALDPEDPDEEIAPDDPMMQSLTAHIVGRALQGDPGGVRHEGEELVAPVRGVGGWPPDDTSIDVKMVPGFTVRLFDALARLSQAVAATQEALRKFLPAMEATGAVPWRQGPGHPPDLGRWTASVLAGCLSRTRPRWTETELAAAFGALGAADLSSRDCVHDLIWNGPGGKRKVSRAGRATRGTAGEVSP